MDKDLRVIRQIAPGEGQALWLITDRVTVKALAEDTGGAYALFEVLNQPRQGMPRHLQRYDDKAFYVLEGRYRFLIDDQASEVGQGGYVFVPRETPHAYTNVGADPARMLILVSPGGIFEQFLAEIGAPDDGLGERADSGADQAAEIARIAMVAEKYGIEIAAAAANERGEAGR